MKKLITNLVCALVIILLMSTAVTNANITQNSNNPDVEPGLVTYGAGDPYYPVPHSSSDNAPDVKTKFKPYDEVFSAESFYFQDMELSDDLDKDGIFDWEARYYNPQGTLMATILDGDNHGTNERTLWSDIMDWKTEGYTSAQAFTYWSLKDKIGSDMALGTWTVESYVEGELTGETSFQVVPVPGALLLGGLGIGCVSYLRRRRSL